MPNLCSRRGLLKLGAVALPTAMFGFAPHVHALNFMHSDETSNVQNPIEFETVSDLFPTQPPKLAREMVTVAHYDLKRVKELVEGRPSLARASWDWGFGDCEDARGGASHMGNRPIAEYLISKGARPTLFSAAMLGQLDVVKGIIATQPGAQRIQGPHSISLLAHARAGGEAARPVFNFLQSLGDASADPPAPLSEEDVNAVTGTYVFGPGVGQQIDLTMERMLDPNDMKTMMNQLTWTRKGTMGRPINHLGKRTFYPWGAPAVRIQFAEQNGSTVMTVFDPDPVLVARLRKTTS